MKVVLINPDIPWNTGNIGRTCVSTNNELVLVGKLGFKITDKEIRRSGLDYWQYLKVSTYESFEKFLETLENPNLLFFSTKGKKIYWDAPYDKNSCLIFGSETHGLPKDYYEKYKDLMYKIPMYSPHIRSLNLSTSAGLIIYKAMETINKNNL